MSPGLRSYKHASCRVHEPTSVPEHLRGQMRELLSLQSEHKRKGEARDLMHRVCREADFHRMVLMLTAKRYDDGASTDKLKDFYRRFGFFVASETAPDIMLRAPKPMGRR